LESPADFVIERKPMLRIRPAHAIVLGAFAAAVIVPWMALNLEMQVPNQIVPGPPTTPQPTVPCTPLSGCGRGPGTQRDVAFAWIDRYCNGDAVPTPPGFTTFAVNYGLGGQSSGPVQFHGSVTVNGAAFPTDPLAILQPGQKDTRIKAAVIPIDAVVLFDITGTVLATGQPVIFGNGTSTRIRTASGGCPGAPATTTPTVVTSVPINSVPPGAIFPPTR